MLFAIKNKFDNDPRLGNFYIWYHGVYEDSKKDASKMEQAIKDKFEAFGLKLS